jgi:hypothetical protein
MQPKAGVTTGLRAYCVQAAARLNARRATATATIASTAIKPIPRPTSPLPALPLKRSRAALTECVLAARPEGERVGEGPRHEADQRQQAEHQRHALRIHGEAERDGHDDHHDRLDLEDHHVAQRAAEEHRGAAHRRHAHPFDDALAEFRDQPEADEQAEHRELDQQPRDKHVVGTARREAGCTCDRLQERAEEHEVEDRLEQPDEDPDRVAQGEPH